VVCFDFSDSFSLSLPLPLSLISILLVSFFSREPSENFHFPLSHAGKSFLLEQRRPSCGLCPLPVDHTHGHSIPLSPGSLNLPSPVETSLLPPHLCLLQLLPTPTTHCAFAAGGSHGGSFCQRLRGKAIPSGRNKVRNLQFPCEVFFFFSPPRGGG
jgi:hypothetical protein